MGFICAICSDSLENTHVGDSDSDGDGKRSRSNLSAVPCGHIFHTYCINTWTSSGVPSSNLCPNCRKCIPRRTCIELFPDSYDENTSPSSPNSEDKQKSEREQYEKDVEALKSKIYRVEADFKIQLSLYELLTRDHQANIKLFNDQCRLKDAEIASLRSDATNAKQQLELEVQKLKSELWLTHHKLEAERNGRNDDRKKQVEFCERFAAQINSQRLELLSHSLQFQRDSALQKPEIDLKVETVRHGKGKPSKSRPINSIYGMGKPKRGKKMVYEKGPDSEPEIEELQVDDSDDDNDIDITSGQLDPRKRKLPRLRPANPEIPKQKIKRMPPTELSLSPITLTLSSDSEDEVHAAGTSGSNPAEPIPGIGDMPTTSSSTPNTPAEPVTMDTTA